MANHLFLKTIYTQPLAIMDIIQAYSRWSEKNIDDRVYREIHDTDETGTSKEIVEEFFIDHHYILTARILLDPTNPSIILLETKSFVHNAASTQVGNIKENNNEYLTHDKCIKINAGRIFGSSSFAVEENGPGEITTGGGTIPQSQGDAFRDQYINTGVTGWQDMGTGYKIAVQKTGCGYNVNVYNNTSGTMYTTRIHNTDKTSIYLDQVAGYVPGFGDAVNNL